MKAIHRIWLGDEMPPTFKEFGERWVSLNPGWMLCEWTDYDDVPIEGPLYDLFHASKTIFPDDWKRFEADLLRLELLYRFGGLYVDTDVEPLEPIGDRFNKRDTFYAARSPQGGTVHPITNAVMYSSKKHPFVNQCIIEIAQAVYVYGGERLAMAVGPWHLTRMYDAGFWPTVEIIEGLYAKNSWLIHHWNTGKRKRGKGLG
jgi:inositol phosphorylceramide mannosyltransferase catalytic subunit